MLTFLVLTFWEPPSRITICSFIVPDPEGLCELWPSSQRMVYHDMMSILPQYKTIPDNPFSHDSTVCKHIIHDWYVHIGPGETTPMPLPLATPLHWNENKNKLMHIHYFLVNDFHMLVSHILIHKKCNTGFNRSILKYS